MVCQYSLSNTFAALLPMIQKVALNVISQLQPTDEAFVVAFKAIPELIQDFTNNQRALANAIDQIYTSGGTSLYDAVIATSDHVYKKGKSRRKAMIFITDGLEKNSSVKEGKVITTLIENQAQVYFICMPTEIPIPFRGAMNKSPPKERLDHLAKASGGQFFSLDIVDETASTAAKIV